MNEYSTCRECGDDFPTSDLNDFMVCYVCDHNCVEECGNPCEVIVEGATKTNHIYIFDCLDCGNFYGEQTVTPDGRLLCPSCFSEQNVEAEWVEAVPVKGEVTPFTAGILCEYCDQPKDREIGEPYCYKCDPTFEMNQ